MTKEEFVSPRGRMWIDERGVVHASYTKGVTITAAEAAEDVETAKKLSGGGNVLMLVDLGNIKVLTSDARAYFASERVGAEVRAVALLASSPVARVLGNFFIGLNRPPYPVKCFATEQQAMKWLEEIGK